MRAVLKRHRRPNARGIAPVLDIRAAMVAPATGTSHGDLWAAFGFVGEKAFSIPLHSHSYWRERQGKRCNVLQIVPDQRGFSIRLMTDMAEPFAASRAAYQPRCERVGVDFGLTTLMATDRGDLMGRGFLDAMRRIDRQLVAIARHRMRFDFRMSGLSRRLNRILSNCGRAAFRAKLADLRDRIAGRIQPLNADSLFL